MNDERADAGRVGIGDLAEVLPVLAALVPVDMPAIRPVGSVGWSPRGVRRRTP